MSADPEQETSTGVTEVGRTRDVGFEIGVSRTFDAELADAWDVLTGAGAELWLGVPGEQVTWEKGASGVAVDGSGFELRSFRPLDRIRVIWSPTDGPDSTVQVTVRSTGAGRTAVRFHQERLVDGIARAARRGDWTSVLDRLEPLLQGEQ